MHTRCAHTPLHAELGQPPSELVACRQTRTGRMAVAVAAAARVLAAASSARHCTRCMLKHPDAPRHLELPLVKGWPVSLLPCIPLARNQIKWRVAGRHRRQQGRSSSVRLHRVHSVCSVRAASALQDAASAARSADADATAGQRSMTALPAARRLLLAVCALTAAACVLGSWSSSAARAIRATGASGGDGGWGGDDGGTTAGAAAGATCSRSPRSCRCSWTSLSSLMPPAPSPWSCP